MIIKKFQGRTKEEAFESARKELGEGLVEMNVKTVKNKGALGWFRKTMVEVTVAKEEEKPFVIPEPKKEVIIPERKLEILPEPKETDNSGVLEEKLDTLQTLIEKQLSIKETENAAKEKEEEQESQEHKERMSFLKILYSKMTDNELDEKYAHELIEEIDRNCKPDVTLDYMLSEIYQKMILKLGKAYVMKGDENGPTVAFFVGPTGVGKTTTIAKIASSYRIEKHMKVALLTADTYRIAAAEQLRTYANILEVPFRVVYTEEEMAAAIEDFKDYDFILVDTTGHSPNNDSQFEDMSDLINAVETPAKKEVFLVLSASTKYKDLKKIADMYKGLSDYKLIFTKLDETSTLGSIYNLRIYTGAMVSYVTYGQSVPDDIDYFNPQSTVKQLLGGRR